jgi:hypothetical protein
MDGLEMVFIEKNLIKTRLLMAGKMKLFKEIVDFLK